MGKVIWIPFHMYDFSLLFSSDVNSRRVNDTDVNTDWLEYICNKQERLRKEANRYWTVQNYVLLWWNMKFHASSDPHYRFTFWYYPAISVWKVLFI